MAKVKVFVTSSDYCEAGLKILREKCEIVQSTYSGFDSNIEDTRNEYLKQVKGVYGIVWSTKLKLDKDILDAAGPQLKIVSAMSVGVDHIDKEELKKRGIPLTNTPGVLDESVAVVAIGLMICASRRFKEGCEDVTTGQWKLGPQDFLGRDIEGSTVGIIGLGRIGQNIVKKLQAFNVKKIIYTGHKEKPEGKALGASFLSLEELLKDSDYVILACPLTSETNNLMNAESIRKMKKTGIIINIGRGGLIDQDSLVDALRSGTIWAAGLDVTVPEPLPNDHPLISLPNCYLTPHIGSATIDTRNKMAELAATNIVLSIEGEELITPFYY